MTNAVSPLQKRINDFLFQGAEISRQYTCQKAVNNKTAETELLPHILPNCSEKISAIPNAVLRGALFGVVGKGYRKYQKNVVKAAINGVTVKFTGEQLDQADLDVWAECLRLNQGVLLGQKIYFSSNAFLARIGRSTGKPNRDWLHDSLRRLMTSLVEIGDGRCFYSGQLLHHWYRDENTGKNSLKLNQELLSLFQAQLWTGLSTEQRFELKGKPLAQWLHGFYSTHENPFGYKVDTLLRLCGSDINFLWKFRQMIKKSLIDLSAATNWKCWIDEHDLVQVKKK